MIRTLLNLVISVISLLVVCACSTVGEQKTEWGSTEAVLSENMPIVFGKLDNFNKGKPEKLEWGFDHFILIQPENANKGIPVKMDRDGWFFLSLKPGSYAIRGVLSGPTTIFLNENFTVPGGNTAIYVGNIMLDKGAATHSMLIHNAEQAAFSEFHQRYPESQIQPEIHQMSSGPEIGSYNNMLGVCAKKWQCECTLQIQGLEPVSPPLEHGMTDTSFTNVDVLQPTMRWKPSAAPVFTYDLAIWEATSYRINALATRYLPGTLALYEENLANPEFTLTTPLKPKTRYYWSVRLRDGDTVSTWSRAGHFTFLLVGWTSGTGEWFAFETP